MPELAASGAAQQLAALFKQQGLLDAQGLLAHDPRGSDWRRAVTSSSIPGELLMTSGASHLRC
jgi:hypothetical protein